MEIVQNGRDGVIGLQSVRSFAHKGGEGEGLKGTLLENGIKIIVYRIDRFGIAVDKYIHGCCDSLLCKGFFNVFFSFEFQAADRIIVGKGTFICFHFHFE